MPARADPMFASVSLNGADTGAVVSFERSGNALFVPWRELKRLGLQVDPPAGANGDSPVELARVPGLKYSIDTQNQAVALDADAALLPHRTLGVAQAAYARPDPAAWGAAIDYAVNIQGSNGWAGGQARIFGPMGVVTNGFVATATRRGVAYRRLETNLVLDDYDRGRSLTIGDFVSGNSSSGRAVRAAGVRLASDSGLRPDLFTQPLIEISGEAALPSTVELFVDGVRRYRATADPGRFTVQTPPMVNSRGELSLVVTDALGRQTVVTRPFYTTSSLLRAGADDYAVDAGWLREGYATVDDRYAEAFAAFGFRRGITNNLTLETHGEVTGKLRAAGVGAVAALKRAVLLNAALDVSDGEAGQGARLRVSARREAAAYGLWATYEGRTAGFRELGRRQPDDTPGQDIQVGGALRGDRWGDLSLTYNRRDSRGEEYGLATAAWSGQFRRLNLYASATFARDRYGGRTVAFGFTAPLGGGSGLASASIDSAGGGRVTAQASQPPPDGQGWGWRAGGDRSLDTGRMRGDGEVRYVSPVGEAALGVAADRQGASLRAYASGSVVWLGGRPRLARSSGDAVALVETGEPGVELMVENRSAGRTGRDGSLLLVNLPAQASSRIEIAAESVDMDASIATEDVVIRPRRRGAVRVSLPIRRTVNLQAQVTDVTGRHLPVGAPVRLNGRPAGFVGFDSWIYLEDVRSENVIEIELAEGACRFRLAPAAPPGGVLPPQVCAAGDPGGGLRRAGADDPDPRARVAELHRDDPAGGVRGLSVLRLRSEDRPGGGDGQVHLYRLRLPGLLVRLERSVRRLGFGDRPPDDAPRRDRDTQLSALR
ncbi:MAG: fimbria/pilus outer membrane usher protein [Alphaproteobacteria bacterium]|nr:fimbria/pilus outer membrane usher protein [Alphaproteobacteria bacterium]